ncbi:hypothetical protein BH11PLA1_BH11PLA1_11810 [soil metagenome]
MRSQRSAFTLVELLAVLVILSIISGVAVGKFIDHRAKALKASEDATARIVRAGVSQYITSNAVRGYTLPPAQLDAVAPNLEAAPSRPLFANVLDTAVTAQWTTGAAPNTYIGPAGTTYAYVPALGAFTTDLVAAAAAAAPPAPTAPTMTLTNASTWTAGSAGSPALSAGAFVGPGYALNDGVIELTDSGPFSEDSRRTAITGTGVSEGTYDIALDTRLTNYWDQLNYWQVYLVKSGTSLNLQGNALNWGSAPPGAKLVSQDYAPDEKSDGNWYSYSNQVNVSAADAAEYDQIVVMMAGTKAEGQILSWRNVAITKR